MQTADVVADESISPDERERKLEAVDGVHRKLQSLVRSFRMPRHLAFQSPSGAADGSSSMTTTTTMPKLVYNAEMAPVYAYEESMMKLLEELDKIESDGDVEVRKARKARVSAVEAELARLDADKKREWSKQQSQPARPPRSPRRPVGREKHDVVNDSAPARRTASPEQPLQEGPFFAS